MPKANSNKKVGHREQLINTALKLFNRDGFHATGIDTILAESGVAKMTLYKHFKSKHELILATLRRRDEDFRNWMRGEWQQRSRGVPPPESVLVLFDIIETWMRSDFYGCIFINSVAEFSDHEDPVHMEAAHHKRLMMKFLEEVCVAAGVENSAELGCQLELLISGAIVNAQITGNMTALPKARLGAETLVREALARDGAKVRSTGGRRKSASTGDD